MICPICGTQQRASSQCVQCHTPFSGVKKTEEESGAHGIEPSSDESLRPPTSVPDEALVSEIAGTPGPSRTSYPLGLPVEDPSLPKPQLVAAKKAYSVLIATTQRVEGKRIRRYFGLVHASVIINLSAEWATSHASTYQLRFKTGTEAVLSGLKNEAAELGANAVVATTMNTLPLDSETILLSASGTAVLMEGPK